MAPTIEESSDDKLRKAIDSVDIEENDEVMLTSRMQVKPETVPQFEESLKAILKATHHTPGHVSSCVLKPKQGEYCYHTIVKFRNRRALEQLKESVAARGGNLSRMIAIRDSYLQESPSYQIEKSSYGTWISADGTAEAMTWEPENPVNLDPAAKGCEACENPYGVTLQTSFVAPKGQTHLFRDKYQRNNKRAGQKNLRCFPNCRNGRHVSTGFCGDTVIVHVVMSCVTNAGGVKICPFRASNPGICTFGRFVPLDSTHDVTISGPDIQPGQVVAVEEVQQYVRDRAHPIRPWMAGVFKGSTSEGTMQSALFEFNAESKAWHYGWRAPSGQGLSSCDIMHSFEVLFFKPVDDVLYCLEVLQSDGFGVYSSRRAGSAQADSSVTVKKQRIECKIDTASSSTSSPLEPPASLSGEFDFLNENSALMKNSTMHLGFNGPLATPYTMNRRATTGPKTISSDALPWPELYSLFTEEDDLDTLLNEN